MRSVIWTLLLVVATLFTACQSSEQTLSQGVQREPVELSATVDKTEATVGDTISYTLSLDHQTELDLELPDIGLALQGLAIANIDEPEALLRDGRTLLTRTYSLRADLTGSYLIPGVAISYPTGDESSAKAVAPPLFVEVKSVLTDPEDAQQLSDIKSIIRPPVNYTRYWVAGGVFIGILALLFILKKWTSSERVAPFVPPEPPWILANRELAELTKLGLLNTGEARKHFFLLSEILRRYMERRFSVNALELTTEEVIHLFRWGGPLNQKVPTEAEDLARKFLVGADQIKYAKHIPLSDEAGRLEGHCTRFVTLTTPKATSEEEAVQ